jgi:hypothetical protein
MGSDSVLKVPETPIIDFARLMRAEEAESVQEVKCSEYGKAIIEHMS